MKRDIAGEIKEGLRIMVEDLNGVPPQYLVRRVAKAIGKAHAIEKWGRTETEAEAYMGERRWTVSDRKPDDTFDTTFTNVVHEKFQDESWRIWEAEARAAIAVLALSDNQRGDV